MTRRDSIQKIAEQGQKTILNQAAQLRKQLFLSQRQVGEILGLKNHAGISILESGKASPRIDKILQVLAVYGYTLSVVPLKSESSTEKQNRAASL